MNRWMDGVCEAPPLPLEFREMAIREWNEGNRSLLEFFELFQNRLMRLWMEGVAAVCPELGVDGDFPDADDSIFAWVDMPEYFHTRLDCVHSRLGVDAIQGRTIFES